MKFHKVKDYPKYIHGCIFAVHFCEVISSEHLGKILNSITSGFTHLHGFQLLLLLPQFIEITFLVCTNRINLLNLKESLDRLLVIAANGFLKLPNLHMLIKQNLASRDFWRIANSVLNEGKSVIPSLFNDLGVLSFDLGASDKAKLFAKNVSKNSNLDDSGIPLPVFPARTNMKLHNICVTPKMVKKVIANLDLSKASSPDCIPVAVLKNCEPELSYILAELFNKCLKEPCFPDCWKVSSVVPVFKNFGKMSAARKLLPCWSSFCGYE